MTTTKTRPIVATWEGKGEFYTSIQPGMRVVVVPETGGLCGWRICRLDVESAWLSVYPDQHKLLTGALDYGRMDYQVHEGELELVNAYMAR